MKGEPMLNDNEREVMNTADAAAYLGITRDTIFRWEREGLDAPPVHKLAGTCRRYLRSELRSWVATTPQDSETAPGDQTEDRS